jgi:hypothetical protein
MDAFNAVVIRLVSESPDPEATIGAIAQLLNREPSRTTSCRLFPAWCAETGPHYDHISKTLEMDDGDGDLVLCAGVIANSGPDMREIVYLQGDEFTDASSVRAKTAELRGFLDEVDALADRVFADHKGRA